MLHTIKRPLIFTMIMQCHYMQVKHLSYFCIFNMSSFVKLQYSQQEKNVLSWNNITQIFQLGISKTLTIMTTIHCS